MKMKAYSIYSDYTTPEYLGKIFAFSAEDAITRFSGIHPWIRNVSAILD